MDLYIYISPPLISDKWTWRLCVKSCNKWLLSCFSTFSTRDESFSCNVASSVTQFRILRGKFSLCTSVQCCITCWVPCTFSIGSSLCTYAFSSFCTHAGPRLAILVFEMLFIESSLLIWLERSKASKTQTFQNYKVKTVNRIDQCLSLNLHVYRHCKTIHF